MEKHSNSGSKIVLDMANPSKAFKAFVNAGKDNRRVLPSVERFVLSSAEAPRSTDYLHPSEISKQDWCHRASYFLLRGAQPPVKTYGFKTKMIFETGHRIHSMWQNVFYKHGTLYGNWRCIRCRFPFNNIIGPLVCPSCSDSSLEYQEVPVKSEALKITGHSDGILVGYGDPLLLEIKSVGVGSFRYENPDLFYKHDEIGRAHV